MCCKAIVNANKFVETSCKQTISIHSRLRDFENLLDTEATAVQTPSPDSNLVE